MHFQTALAVFRPLSAVEVAHTWLVTCLFLCFAFLPRCPLLLRWIDGSHELLSGADLWTCLLCFHFSSPSALFFWLGSLSGASWGNAWSLPVCLCLLSMLFHVCVRVCVVSVLIHHYSSLPLLKCSYQMPHFVFCASYRHASWHLSPCYVTVFVVHIRFLSYINTITCSPLIEKKKCVKWFALWCN